MEGLYRFLRRYDNRVVIIRYCNPKTYSNQSLHRLLYDFIHQRTFLAAKKFLFMCANRIFFSIFRRRFTFRSPRIRYQHCFCGSDQVLHMEFTGFDETHVNASGIDAVHRHLYAGSFGSYLPNGEDERTIVCNYLDKLENISFREKPPIALFQNVVNEPILHVCDPTLLMPISHWNALACRHYKKPFIFLYYATPILLDEAVKYAQEHGCFICYSYPLCSIPRERFFVHVHDDPKSFLSRIKQAEYVFTSSFHCAVFSLIFNKPLFCPVDENDRRYGRIAEMLSYFDPRLFNSIQRDMPNYDLYNLLGAWIGQSKAFIERCINNEFVS